MLHTLLAFGDAGCHQHTAALGISRQLLALFIPVGGVLRWYAVSTAMEEHLLLIRQAQQEHITEGAIAHAVNLDTKGALKQPRVFAAHQQSARVIVEVMQPVFQLSSAQQQFIIKAAGKEQAMRAVFLRARALSGLLRLSRNIRNRPRKQLAVATAAPGLKATDNPAEVFLHLLLYEDDAMHVIGHHLQGDDLHLWVIPGDAPPLIAYPLSQCAQLYPWCLIATIGRPTATHYPAKERASPLGRHRDHIHHAVCIVMIYTAP